MANHTAAAIAAPETRKHIDFVDLLQRIDEACEEMFEMDRDGNVIKSYSKEQQKAVEQLVKACVYVMDNFYDTKEDEVIIYDY